MYIGGGAVLFTGDRDRGPTATPLSEYLRTGDRFSLMCPLAAYAPLGRPLFLVGGECGKMG